MRLLDVLILGAILFFVMPLLVGCASAPVSESPTCSEVQILMALRPDNTLDQQVERVQEMISYGCSSGK